MSNCNYTPDMKKQILYSGPYYDNNEIDYVFHILMNGNWLTDGPEVRAFEKEFSAMFHCYYSLMVNSGSSANLVSILALKKRYKLGCGSNAQKYSVLEMLELAEIKDYFDEIIGNDEGFPNKPDPSIYLELMKRIRVKPEECLIVEDNKYGIEAAKASGAKVIEVKGYNDVDLGLFIEYL